MADVRVFSDSHLRIVQPGRYECDQVLDDDSSDGSNDESQDDQRELGNQPSAERQALSSKVDRGSANDNGGTCSVTGLIAT